MVLSMRVSSERDHVAVRVAFVSFRVSVAVTLAVTVAVAVAMAMALSVAVGPAARRASFLVHGEGNQLAIGVGHGHRVRHHVVAQ